MLNHTRGGKTTSCVQPLYSVARFACASAARQSPATFMIFIAFGAQTATYVQRYKSKPGPNPIYARLEKAWTRRRGKRASSCARLVCQRVALANACIAAPQESKTPALRITRWPVYRDIKSEIRARARKSLPCAPRLICKRPHRSEKSRHALAHAR